MKTFLLLLSAFVATHAQGDPCTLTTSSQPNCPAGTTSNATIYVGDVRDCQQPSIWWNYPCGTLNVTLSYDEYDFGLCITSVIGGVTRIAYVPEGREPPKPLPLPSSGKPSCVPLMNVFVKLIFTASKEQTFGAGIDYTIDKPPRLH